MNGGIVRLRRGNTEDLTRFDDFGSPLDVAQKWESEGAELLHVVDLDAALGTGNNQLIIEQILNELAIPIHFGGGVRDEATANMFLDIGVERIILGTLAIQKENHVRSIGEAYGFDRIVIALDYKSKKVMSDGWQSSISINPSKLLSSFRKAGVRHFLMTSVNKDGCMNGPDTKLAKKISTKKSDIIIAGGISSIEDILDLASKGFEAAVIGRALYEGAFNLSEAIMVGRRSMT
jgi:phosphoribosylformimino-5-aminoimidazole carboxamide ribotide isomerase